MAEKPDRSQKTEQPTPKRKREARRDGQIPRSAELTGWTALLAATWLLPAAMGRVAESLWADMRVVQEVIAQPDPGRALEALGSALWSMVVAIGPFLAILTVLGLLGSLAQVGLVLTARPLKPKSERINPLAGFRRMFSARSLWETARSVLKVLLIAVVAVPAIRALTVGLVGGQQFELGATLPYVAGELLALVRLVAALGVVVAVADYLFQRYRHRRDLMMTRHEVRQEMRNSEGDPLLKAKARSLQRGMSRNRMLAAVPDATVVITNPTHLAVALRYEPGDNAPRVLAKGAGAVAARIRAAAAEHLVPVVEAKPLARALHDACNVGDEIPADLFEAVARVLAFLHHRGSRAALSGVWVMPTG